MKDIKEQLENLYLAGFNKNDARGRKIIGELSQTISDTRREERERIVKLFMSYPFEMLDFHDGDMKKAVFVKKKDLLDFLSKLQKNKGENGK